MASIFSIYEHYIKNPPIKNGARYRGNSSADEYWRGYDGYPSNGSRKGSISADAYRAGKHAASGAA